MLEKYLVSTSPHISSPATTRGIMGSVCIALIPSLIAAILLYGFYPLVVVLLSVASAVLGETLFNKIRKKPNTVKDLSAVVTGFILGLSLPPVVALYVPIIGGIFAIMLVKMLFGGLGKNFANPALTARIFVMLAWGTVMNIYVPTIDLSLGFGEMFKYFGMSTSELSALTSATPLASYAASGSFGASNLDLFLGRISGSAGEVSAIAILIGGVYLAVKRIIDVKIPVIYVITTVLFAAIFYGDISVAIPTALSGGLLFGAVFMATDYSTNPNTFWGAIIFAFGCGLLTAIFRKFGTMPEGVSFAILIMNIVTPLLDKYIKPRPFGYQKPVKVKKVKAQKEEAK